MSPGEGQVRCIPIVLDHRATATREQPKTDPGFNNSPAKLSLPEQGLDCP